MGDPIEIAKRWLSQFEAALDGQYNLADCFLESSWFRDVLVFTWDSRTLRDKQIVHYLQQRRNTVFSNFQLDQEPGLEPTLGPLGPGAPTGVSYAFKFQTNLARGRGYVRLLPETVGLEWKALTTFMTLEAFTGYEERGPELGIYRGHTLSWTDVWASRKKLIEQDPLVLIVGAGQTGLNVAARFSQMMIPSLVIEQNDRIGDNWRQRYKSLSLHTISRHHSMLYQSYPTTWPVYTSRDKLSDWLEQYAQSQDLVVWTSSCLLPTPTYDPMSRRWTTVIEKNGSHLTLRPAHIILATGTLGAPYLPSNLSGRENFLGTILHSSAYTGAEDVVGKQIVVVGAANTAADVCQDLHTRGAGSITMIQRSPTCVADISTIRELQEANFPTSETVEVSDFKFAATPLKFLKAVLAMNADSLRAREMETHEGLLKAGFKAHLGEDGSGILPLVFERGAGLDVGCAKLIIEGKVKVKHGVEVTSFEDRRVLFSDASVLPADIVVFATGYRGMRKTAESLFGNEVISKTSKIFGLDDEGELHGCYRPTGYPGLWYAAGDFQISRYWSKQMGLLIRAQELDLIDPVGAVQTKL